MPTTHDYYDDPRNVDIKIYIDGDFFHRNEAKVSVLDSGFLLGDGVWEGIRLHNSKLLHLEKMSKLTEDMHWLNTPMIGIKML